MNPTPSGQPHAAGKPECPAALRQDAQAWVRRLASGKVTVFEARAFERWRASSAEHQAAFEEARAQWRLLGPAIGELLAGDAEAALYHRHTLRPRAVGRRAFLGGAVGTAAAVGVAVYSPLGLWPPAGEWNADWRTATGEQRAVTLAGEANIVMNTRTSVRRIPEQEGAPGLELLHGEAEIEMLPGRQIFSVAAGVGRSMADRARFEVRHLDGRVCVTCAEGQVRVEHPGGTRLLQARQQVAYETASIGAVTGVDPADVSAWRRGELVFRKAALASVVDEINRYRPGRVVLVAPSLRDSTVSARFQLAALDTALLQIQQSFGLTARTLPGGVLVLS